MTREQLIVTIGLVALWAGMAAAISDADKCAAAKNKIAGKYAFCRQTAEAKAIKTGDPVDYTKCASNFATKWGTAETNGGGMCPTNGDAGSMQTFVSQHTDAVAAALAGGGLQRCPLLATGQTTAYGTGSDGDVQAGAALSYTDNGDGTITDNNTELMWEKKDDSGGIHDVDNMYTWCVDVSPLDNDCDNMNGMDGTIVTTFLATLNGGFAGYTDWRIPNVKELQGIVHYGAVAPPWVDAAFHQSATCTGCTDVTAPACSCTAPNSYWSSTTVQFNPHLTWNGTFPGALFGSKTTTRRIRAVRAGFGRPIVVDPNP